MPDLAKLGGRACLAAEYICLTSGSFRMIHSPTCSSSPPSHDDINIPARPHGPCHARTRPCIQSISLTYHRISNKALDIDILKARVGPELHAVSRAIYWQRTNALDMTLVARTVLQQRFGHAPVPMMKAMEVTKPRPNTW